MTKKFVFLKDVYMSLLELDGCVTHYETVDPTDKYWLELEDDGKLFLYSDMGKEKRRVKTTWDMAEGGRFKEVKDIPAAWKDTTKSNAATHKNIPPLMGHDS